MRERLAIVCGTSLAYGVLFMVNEWLFGALGFSAATHWIYLPGGLRLVFVLLFGFLGAVGVALASVTVSYLFYFENDPLSAFGAGVISGTAPYLSRHICLRYMQLDPELRNLTAERLLKVSLLFALISAGLHQILFTWQGYTDDFVTTASVMAFGDFMGSIIVLYVAKFVMSRLKWSESISNQDR